MEEGWRDGLAILLKGWRKEEEKEKQEEEEEEEEENVCLI